MKLCFRLIVAMLCLTLSAMPGTVAAAAQGAMDELEVTLDFQNVELVDMIETISELTGKNFVYDESVRGKVSVVSPRPVSVAEAYHLFSTVLKVKGFTIIPSGKVNKIVSVRNAKMDNLPVSDGRGVGEQYISHIMQLDNLDAATVVDTILRPLMPKTSHVVAYAPTNTVIMTDSAANIKRLTRILSRLDRSWDGDLREMVQLRYAEAEEAAALVQQILEGRSTATVSRNTKQATSVGRKISGVVIPYARTNKLMLLGDNSFIAHARRLIAEIDVKSDINHNRSGIHVYYLEHAEAEPLAETLNRIVTGSSKGSTNNKDDERKAVFGEVLVTADKPTNALIVNATSKDYDNIQSLIRQLDIKRKQVYVEALILEVSMDAALDLGVTLGGAIETGSDSVLVGSTNSDSGITDGAGYASSVLSDAVSGIMLGGLFNPITTTVNGEELTIPALSALIDLSQTDKNVNLLSAPRLLTSDNEEAEIIVGQNVPVISSSSTDDSGDTVYSIDRQDAALTLRFTPQITEGDQVRLEIYQEITAVTDSVGDLDSVGPTFTKRLVSNSIVAEDGKTVVLGGLFQTEVTKSVTKVPLLGDIPILGNLFKSTSDEEDKTSLLIFITPKIIRDSDDMARVTRQSRINMESFKQEHGQDVLLEQIEEFEGIEVYDPTADDEELED